MIDLKKIPLTPQQLLASCAGVLFLLYALFVIHGLHSPQDWEKTAKDAIHTADSIRVVNEHAIKVADSLHKAADQKTVEIKALVKVADSLHTVAEHRRKGIETRAAALPDTCKAVVHDALALADTYQAEANKWHTAVIEGNVRDSLRLSEIDTLRSSLLRVNRSNAELTEQVRAALRREKLFGVVPMPSRTQSFFIGAAAGIAAAVYIQRH